MSGNNVTLTEQGHLVVGNVGIPAAVVPAIEAHYRAKFVAERMPEDVQALVEKAQARTGEWTDIANATTDIRLIAGLAAALEAAYSQKGGGVPTEATISDTIAHAWNIARRQTREDGKERSVIGVAAKAVHDLLTKGADHEPR